MRRLMQFKTNHHTHVAAFIEQLQGSPPSSAALEKLEDHRAALRAASAIMGDASLSRGSDIFTGAMTACVEDNNSAKDMAAHAAAGLSTVDIFYSDVLSVGGIVASTNSVLGDKSAAGPKISCRQCRSARIICKTMLEHTPVRQDFLLTLLTLLSSSCQHA